METNKLNLLKILEELKKERDEFEIYSADFITYEIDELSEDRKENFNSRLIMHHAKIDWLIFQFNELCQDYAESNSDGYKTVTSLMNGYEKIANDLMIKYQKSTSRYIEAERFICDLNWIERVFVYRKILRFFKRQFEKYNF